MWKLIACCALLYGVLLLIDVGVMLLELARTLRPFGGIIWSWGLLSNNPRWVVKAVMGIVLCLGGLVVLVRSALRPSALSQPADPL